MEVNCYRKMYNRWWRLLNMLLPAPDLHWVGPLVLWDFRNIFQPNTGEDQIKVLSEHGAPGTLSYGKSIPGYCITFIKKIRWGLQLATFRIKTLNFARVIRLNWLANIKLKGPGPPGSILLLGAHLNWGPFNY